MPNRLLPLVVIVRERWPALYRLLVRIGSRLFRSQLGLYPHTLGNEIAAVSDVLRSTQWNMAYGKGLVHERLEADFADHVGVPHAIAVASGGVALQMSLRAFGLGHGAEVIHQIDTCSATAMACMNAGVTPIFADISHDTFMLDMASVSSAISSDTRGLIGTHMWGNPENMKALRTLADERGYKLIEDACLGLGATAQKRAAGSWGDVAVFSFGCIKPIQAGEGGMIVTHDAALARELRAMRHWGDRTIDFGERDSLQLSWNGRMSEILAALVREQLRGYPKHLAQVRDAVTTFAAFLENMPGIKLELGTATAIDECGFTQAVLRLDEAQMGISKKMLWDHLTQAGVRVWHANFEPINTLSLFRKGTWREWILRGDLERVSHNYAGSYPTAQYAYEHSGFGLSKMNFLSQGNLKHLMSSIEAAVAKAGRR